MHELIIDNFAGGGGASTGIEQALGRPVDIAINHDPVAIAMHCANHPKTRHLCEDVFDVDPAKVANGRPVGLVWFSPDCKHFSRAKGGKPVSKKIRGLAWVAVEWAKAVHPRVIILENVEEFETWGPLGADMLPLPERKGETFKRFCKALVDEGYQVQWRSLRACEYGAPTIRRRLFLVARCDDRPIVWPSPTHGEGLLPYRTAAECISWSIPCPSIFERKRPLCPATMARIAKGIWKYVINAAEPFIVPLTHQESRSPHDINEPMRTVTGANRGELALCAAFLAKHYGGPNGKQTPGVPMDRPIGTVTPKDHHALVTALLSHCYSSNTSGGEGDLSKPARTVTAQGTHHALVCASIDRQFGASEGAAIDEPLGTVMPGGMGKTQVVQAFLRQHPGDPMAACRPTSRLGLVCVNGIDYSISNIGMRMLQPRELFRAQGFPPGYIIDPAHKGKPLTKTAQVAAAGNSVCPPIARALVEANCEGPRVTIELGTGEVIDVGYAVECPIGGRDICRR